MIIPNTKNSKVGKISDLSAQINNSCKRSSWTIAKDLSSSFQYAAQGLIYAFRTQRNFRIHLLIGFLASSISIWLNLSVTNLAIIVITISAVLVLELINTSIEAVVDLAIGRKFHPLARVAKDCAAASVLLGSISSFIIALLLILPLILERLGI